MADTTIEWATKVWNAVVGCEYCSTGCTFCYAARMAATRLKHTEVYVGIATKEKGEPAVFTGEVRCLPDKLEDPYKWRAPQLVFVNSMSDQFHPSVPFGFTMRMWEVMAQNPQHIFQVLTKRPQRMAKFVKLWCHVEEPVLIELPGVGMPPMPRGPEAVAKTYSSGRSKLFVEMLDNMGTPPAGAAYPLYDWMEGMRWWPRVVPNIWLGTSIESNEFVWRANHLRDLDVAVRFLSLEPLLGPLPDLDLTGIDWVIVGGESGPGEIRPMHPDWVRPIRDQCQDLGIPFFFKQWGGWAPAPWKVTVGESGPVQPSLAVRKQVAESVGATHNLRADGHLSRLSQKCWSIERSDEPAADQWGVRRDRGHGGHLLDGERLQSYPAGRR